MPIMRPCLDCGALTRASRCHACERQRDVARGSTHERGYGSAWKRMSRQVRAHVSICARCGRRDDLTLDHVIPLAHGGQSVPSNLAVLCRSCNSAKRDRA